MPQPLSLGSLRRLGLATALLLASSSLAAQPQDPPPAETADRTIHIPAQTDTESDGRIDPTSGREMRVWPPDPLFDYKHMRLDITIPTMAKRAYSAVQTITLTPIGIPRDEIALDAGARLKFSQVSVNGRPSEFTHDDARLTIRLGRPFAPGEPITLRSTYTADRGGGNGEGLTWSVDDKRTPEEDFMMHAQGEADHNHLWFPCHDFPNVRMSTELFVTVPEPYEVVSNGRLVGVSRRLDRPTPHSGTIATNGQPEGDDSPPSMSTYHWLQERPHAPYLVTLVVGRFDVVNLGGPESARPGLWMPVYGPLGSADRIRTLFANTPAMVAFFERTLDMPFPWDKYAQIICRDFAAGAMENTSASTFADGASRGRRAGALDSVISHELMHQWFGDLVACASWEHVWLNEGWATMGEALWAEHQKGEGAYQSTILRSLSIERGLSRNRRAPRDAPLASNRYDNPDDRFMGPDNAYHKGCFVLHMLRERLGDDLFFRTAREFLRAHAYSAVETDDMRQAFERVSAQSLERFFGQWVLRPGHPDLGIDYEWTPEASGLGSGSLSIRVEQLQDIDADNPAYAFVLPFVVKFDNGEPDARTIEVPMDTRTADIAISLPHKPKEIQVDPRMTVLSNNRVRQSLEASIRQLLPDETLYVRYQAVLNLAANGDDSALAALARLAEDTSQSDDLDLDDPAAVLGSVARRAIAAIERRTSPAIDHAAR